MVRYPHTLSVSYRGSGSYDGTGDYQVGSVTSMDITGRAERNSKGSLITLNDGAQVTYSWEFYTQALSYSIPFNADAELSDEDGTFWRGQFLGMSKTQAGTKIWL